MRDPHLGSCQAPCYLVNHLRNHIIEVILPHPVSTVRHRLGSRTNSPLRRSRSHRIDQHIYPLVLLDLFLLVREEAVDRETTAKPLVNPTPMLSED